MVGKAPLCRRGPRIPGPRPDGEPSLSSLRTDSLELSYYVWAPLRGSVQRGGSMKRLTFVLLLFGVLAFTASPATAQTCNGTFGQWSGCRGTGCSVCWEFVSSYPYYFINHPSCIPNSNCQGQYFTCNEACPAPSSADFQCNGTQGQWSGCRGTGCSVCAELVAEYPCYFQNHPACIQNTNCQGAYFTCNANCPAPTEADRCETSCQPGTAKSEPAGCCNPNKGRVANYFCNSSGSWEFQDTVCHGDCLPGPPPD